MHFSHLIWPFRPFGAAELANAFIQLRMHHIVIWPLLKFFAVCLSSFIMCIRLDKGFLHFHWNLFKSHIYKYSEDLSIYLSKHTYMNDNILNSEKLCKQVKAL